MLKIFKKIIFHSNGRPRALFRSIVFDAKFKVRKIFFSVVYNRDGLIRNSFYSWYTRVLVNPGSKVDPKWRNERREILASRLCGVGDDDRICIVSPPATFYIAYWLRENLQDRGFIVSVYEEMPAEFTDELYFVVCAQLFSRLPPRHKRIIYQLEQSVTLRWFTEDYINILYNSLAVFDYSKFNIRYLQGLPDPLDNLYHVPVSTLKSDLSWLSSFKKNNVDEFYEVLFYGDIKNKRRLNFIANLSKSFNIKVITNLYELDLWKNLLKAKVVVNIHYYENALLETTRICECLSLGVKVVSEVGSDQEDYINQFEDVIFTPVGDVQTMIKAISFFLDTPTPMNNSSGVNCGSESNVSVLHDVLDELNL